ncbi:MAG: hypothetical protein GQ577_12385 [Woeseiaceae bacterium]|jgi:hypothetical protein|nr:hypothetical protein [Woeseiaceae bacterium]
MAIAFPTIGKWFRRPDGTLLEVVAVDEDDGTIEIQFFDGTIDEVEIDAWRGQFLIEAAAPEDWSGSVDMDPDDYKGTRTDEMPAGFHDPLEFLSKD